MSTYSAHVDRHNARVNVLFLLLIDRDLAAMDENAASACFHALLVYLEELRNRSVQENNILQGPDYPGMRQYLLVGQTCCYGELNCTDHYIKHLL